MASVISLAELLERRVPLAWYEAVAIIQEVCEAYIAEGSIRPDAQFGGAARIEITSRGEVRVGFGIASRAGRFLQSPPRSDAPAAEFAQLLNAALVEASPPAQLRLLIAQIVAPCPDGSLEDVAKEDVAKEDVAKAVEAFSGALRYFERPGRIEIIRAVYARAQESSAVPTRSPEPAPVLEDHRSSRHGRRGRDMMGPAGIWIVLTAVLAMLASIAAFSPTFRAGFNSTRTVAASTIGSGMSVTSTWTRRSLEHARAWAQALGGTSPTSDADGTQSSGGARTARGRRNGPSANARMVPPDASPFSSTGAPVTRAPTSDASRISGAGSPVEPFPRADRTSPAPGSVRVYTSDDRDVTEPVLLGSPLPEGPRDDEAAGFGSVELVVNEAGEVELVKLRSPANRFQDRMILSAIKAWRFRPALRDGQPVKFRKTLRLTFR